MVDVRLKRHPAGGWCPGAGGSMATPALSPLASNLSTIGPSVATLVSPDMGHTMRFGAVPSMREQNTELPAKLERTNMRGTSSCSVHSLELRAARDLWRPR